MNIYVVNAINHNGICIIAADNENIVKFVFNDTYKNYTDNPIKDWKCNITKLDNATINIDVPKILYDNTDLINIM